MKGKTDKQKTHKVMVHPVKYTSKPTSEEAGYIQNKIVEEKNHKTLTLDELALVITEGMSFKIGHFSGKKKTDYIEQSNSLLVIDVDNKYKLNGVEYYTDYTVYDAIEKCETHHLPVALIYTSFNHTDKRHKFRLIFQLNRTVTTSEWEKCLKVIKSKLGVAGKDKDGLCDDKVGMGHFVYGGHRLVLIDHCAILNVNKLLKMPLKQQASNKKNSEKHALSLDTQEVEQSQANTPRSIQSFKNIDKDLGVFEQKHTNPVIPRLREHFEKYFLLKTVHTTVQSRWGAIEYAKTLELHVLLGLPTQLSCLFHEDKKPSAGFFLGVDHVWRYKCFSCNKTHDIIDFIALMYGLSKQRDFAAITDKIITLFHINVANDAWKQSCHAYFYHNELHYAKADSYKQDYPLTSAGMIFTDNLYWLLLREVKLALEYKSAKDIEGVPLVSISRNYIMQRTGLSEDKVRARLQRLLHMGFVRALSNAEMKSISHTLYKASWVNKGNVDKRTSVYAIYPIDTERINTSEQRLKAFKESGATVKGATGRQSFALYKGQENTFSQSTTDSDYVTKDKEILIVWAKRELERKGYIMKENYMRYAYKKGYSEKYASSFIVEILHCLNLRKITGNKEVQKKYGISKAITNKTVFVK